MTRSLWLVVALYLYSAEAIRVLVVFPVPTKSHTILGNGVVRHLLNAGHEVTYITPLDYKNAPPNLRQIDVSENFQHSPTNLLDLTEILKSGKKIDYKTVFDVMINMAKITFRNSNVQKLMRDSNEHFDVIVAEWMFTEVYSTFSAIFGAPYVWVSPVPPHGTLLRLIDDTTSPAYTAELLGPASVPPFSFYERVEQLCYQIFGLAMKKFVASPMEQEIYDELIPFIKLRGHEVPDFETLRYNASLMLGTSHSSFGPAMSLPQNYKPVGGYHVDTEVKPLPEDLKNLMDNAKHGVIYFSMGSTLKSKLMPAVLKQSLLKMFGSLKQTVLWKFEEVLPNLPSNVHIVQWAPQPSILAHPNCKLFITHGGLLSKIETIASGKPIIGIPIFGDQYANVNSAVAAGYAKRVDISYTMAVHMKEAIEEIINNPSYSLKAQELSLVYHDRPTPPGEELVHWVEHVVKTKGAPHLRSPALATPFYQKMYLDLAAVILVIYLVFKKLIQRLIRKNSKKQKTN